MMIDVHLADGRTVFRFVARARLMRLVNRDPATIDEQRAERCWALWHPNQPEWEPVRVQYVRKHSISFIRHVEPTERDQFLSKYAPAELERIRRMETGCAAARVNGHADHVHGAPPAEASA